VREGWVGEAGEGEDKSKYGDEGGLGSGGDDERGRGLGSVVVQGLRARRWV